MVLALPLLGGRERSVPLAGTVQDFVAFLLPSNQDRWGECVGQSKGDGVSSILACASWQVGTLWNRSLRGSGFQPLGSSYHRLEAGATLHGRHDAGPYRASGVKLLIPRYLLDEILSSDTRRTIVPRGSGLRPLHE